MSADRARITLSETLPDSPIGYLCALLPEPGGAIKRIWEKSFVKPEPVILNYLYRVEMRNARVLLSTVCKFRNYILIGIASVEATTPPRCSHQGQGN
jgi:hypothetical protein